MIQLSKLLGHALGHWWLFAVLMVASSFFYGYGVPRAKDRVFANNRGLEPKLLDERLPTWRPRWKQPLQSAALRSWPGGLQQRFISCDFCEAPAIEARRKPTVASTRDQWVGPFPSSKSALNPVHATVPPLCTTQVNPFPADTLVTPVSAGASGDSAPLVVPVPSSP